MKLVFHGYLMTAIVLFGMGRAAYACIALFLAMVVAWRSL